MTKNNPTINSKSAIFPNDVIYVMPKVLSPGLRDAKVLSPKLHKLRHNTFVLPIAHVEIPPLITSHCISMLIAIGLLEDQVYFKASFVFIFLWMQN